MLRLLFLLYTIRSCFSTATHTFPKCCEGSVANLVNSTFLCDQEPNRRVQIVGDEVQLSDNFEKGQCVDTDGTAALFQISEGFLEKVRDLDVISYPKCCPLDYFYSRVTHGCVYSNRTLVPFFNESFVQVGLPQCKTIVDVSVNVNKHSQEPDLGSFFKHGGTAKRAHCLDKDESDFFVLRLCYDDYDVCNTVRCIRKCCPDGQSFVNGSKCKDTFVHGVDLTAYARFVDDVNATFALVHDGFTQPIYALGVERFSFHLDSSGVFTMKEVDDSLGKINVTKSYTVDQKIYCVEHAFKASTNTYLFFRGYPQQVQYKFIYTGIAMVISCFFLVITIIYYCWSEEKKTLFGKILISYCLSSLITFLGLAIFGLTDPDERPVAKYCGPIAFFLFYTTLSTFAWMNVMCIDIFCTFGSSKSFLSHQHKSKEMKRFLMYSVHGWGTPLIITLFPMIFYFTDNLPEPLKVVVNFQKCMLYKGSGNYAVFLFSTIPMAVLEVCNCILFIRTIIFCLRVKREITRMNDTQALKGDKKEKLNNFRDRFGLLMKLFVIMGISFLFEVVSSFYDFKKTEATAIAETVWDSINCLQGLFIFLIFILKKRIFKKVEKKIGLKKLRKISFGSSVMTTQTTSIPTINSKC